MPTSLDDEVGTSDANVEVKIDVIWEGLTGETCCDCVLETVDVTWDVTWDVTGDAMTVLMLNVIMVVLVMVDVTKVATRAAMTDVKVDVIMDVIAKATDVRNEMVTLVRILVGMEVHY